MVLHRPLEAAKELILGPDSSVSETYGQQEGSAQRRFGCSCYHLLFLFNQFGDFERAMLRRGNHHSDKFWQRVLLPVIERNCKYDVPKLFRGDAAFANLALLTLLEDEVAMTRSLFAAILYCIARLALPLPVVSGCPA